jgi:hypothetical protein
MHAITAILLVDIKFEEYFIEHYEHFHPLIYTSLELGAYTKPQQQCMHYPVILYVPIGLGILLFRFLYFLSISSWHGH